MSFVDLDNDGDLDYVENNLNDNAFVLKNTTIEKSEGKAGYLRIKLTGSGNSRMALGAKAEIWSNGKKLPKALQVSPIRKNLVRDFNGDTLPDILFTGNDYTYVVQQVTMMQAKDLFL